MRLGLRAVVAVCSLASCAGLTLPGPDHASSSLGVARADVLSDLNKASFGDIPQNRRSDLVLLPLIAKLAPAPASVGTPRSARLLQKGMKGWDAAQAWALGAPQQEAIKALLQVGQATDFRQAYEFGLPYGFEGVPPELIRADLYANLGDPPTLAATSFGYLRGLDRLESLANVEASRLLGEGKAIEAMNVMMAMAHLSRQMCDRAMIREVSWGLDALTRSLERVRDVAFGAIQAKQTIDLRQLQTIIDRLEPTGYFRIGRVDFPKGDEVGARQVLERVRTEDGWKEDLFALTMAKMGSEGRPLRLFSEAASWRDASRNSVFPEDHRLQIDAIFSDWRTRWGLDSFNSRLTNKTPYDTINRDKFPLLFAAIPDAGRVASLRQVAEVEIVGTRTALACVGVFLTTNNQPNGLPATRPRFVKALDADPFNPDRAKPPLQYFVPRSSVNAVIVFSDASGKETFTVPLTSDAFVLYSVGSDKADAKAARIENTQENVSGADYLVWPPVLTLLRKREVDLGVLE